MVFWLLQLACLRIGSNPQLQAVPAIVLALGDSLVELDISACGLTVLPSEIAMLQLVSRRSFRCVAPLCV